MRRAPAEQSTSKIVSSLGKHVAVINVKRLKHKKENFRAGAVSRCLEKWEQITTDPWILKLVEGYQWKFRYEDGEIQMPYQDFRPQALRLDKETE